MDSSQVKRRRTQERRSRLRFLLLLLGRRRCRASPSRSQVSPFNHTRTAQNSSPAARAAPLTKWLQAPRSAWLYQGGSSGGGGRGGAATHMKRREVSLRQHTGTLLRWLSGAALAVWAARDTARGEERDSSASPLSEPSLDWMPERGLLWPSGGVRGSPQWGGVGWGERRKRDCSALTGRGAGGKRSGAQRQSRGEEGRKFAGAASSWTPWNRRGCSCGREGKGRQRLLLRGTGHRQRDRLSQRRRGGAGGSGCLLREGAVPVRTASSLPRRGGGLWGCPGAAEQVASCVPCRGWEWPRAQIRRGGRKIHRRKQNGCLKKPQEVKTRGAQG